MDPSNYTPITSKKSSKKKSSSIFKIVGLASVAIMFVGVAVGYVMLSQGFNFQPLAANKGKNLTKYGWNGTCFTKLTGIKYAARYQCPGKFSSATIKGCQPGNESQGRRTGNWDYKKNNLVINGKSQVCIIPNGSTSPRDSKGCFTQQLDLDDGSGGGPEGFYSFDKCGTPPTPTVTPTPFVCIQPTPPLCPNGTIAQITPPAGSPLCTQFTCVTPTPTGVCPVPEKPKVHIDCPFCNERNASVQTTTTPTKEVEVCAQVIVFAKNPSTGECRSFGSPCTVADGWVGVDSCPITPTQVPAN